MNTTKVNRDTLIMVFAMLIIALASLVSVPIYAKSSQANLALNACAKALIETIESQKSQSVNFDVDLTTNKNHNRLKNNEVIYLDAVEGNSDKVVARADCLVTADAEVEELRRLPLDAPSAQFRAK